MDMMLWLIDVFVFHLGICNCNDDCCDLHFMIIIVQLLHKAMLFDVYNQMCCTCVMLPTYKQTFGTVIKYFKWGSNPIKPAPLLSKETRRL